MFLWDLFKSIFGVYTPITNVSETVTQTIIDVSGNETITTTTQYITSVDWSYIGAIVVFCILFYCVLRIIGGIICAK